MVIFTYLGYNSLNVSIHPDFKNVVNPFLSSSVYPAVLELVEGFFKSMGSWATFKSPIF